MLAKLVGNARCCFMGNPTETRATAARAFVRSLNILLKFARMYDFGHPRTTAQYETAWSELRAAIGAEEESGLLLAVSGDQLLLDGLPLEAAAAEKSFARMFSSAGIASLHFSPKVTKASLAKFVQAFPTGTNTKASQVAEQLKAALLDDPHIQVNEVCYVTADSAVAKSTLAAQLAARTLGMSTEKTDALFNDPEKLLQMMIAAQGTQRSGGGVATGGAADGGDIDSQNAGAEGESQVTYYASDSPDLVTKNEMVENWAPPESGRSGDGAVALVPGCDSTSSDFSNWNNGEGSGDEAGTNASSGIPAGRAARRGTTSMAVPAGQMTLKEGELQGILQVLSQIARPGGDSKEKLDLPALQAQLAALPQRSQFTMGQVLSTLAAQAPTEAPDGAAMLKLAEHIAVRFALESYERGDTEVNTVQQTLSEMNQELDGLRKVLGVYEEKMTEAGIGVQSQVEVLAQKFWTQVPEEKKKSVLESQEAWCVPGPKVREHVEALRARGEAEAGEKILRNYAKCITNEAGEQRRRTAMGLAELAPFYAGGEEQLFLDTIRMVGVQLARESDAGLQSLVSAALIRLSQEAANKRAYPAIQRAVEMVDYAESEHAAMGKSLRQRIGLENRLPEFIEEALRNRETPSGLTALLRRMPLPACEHIAARFGRAALVEDSESLLWMMEALGPEAIEHLRARFEGGEQNEAIETIGLLTRIDFATVEKILPERMKEWKRAAHDRVVRQIAGSGAPARGRLLLELLDRVDPLVRPAVIDEIGMSGEKSADIRLLRIVEGELPINGSEYLRVKAIEALGRIGTPEAEAVLRKVAEARKTFRWAHPYELRMVATQALNQINPEWVQSFIPRSELSVADLLIEPLAADPDSLTTCQRRYVRFRLDPAVPGVANGPKKNCNVQVRQMSLSGGNAVPDQSLHPGSVVELKLNSGRKAVKMQAVIRTATPQFITFEIVDIDLEERTKLRKLLVQLGNASKQASPEEQNRRDEQVATTVCN
jgi:hypothetical protein